MGIGLTKPSNVEVPVHENAGGDLHDRLLVCGTRTRSFRHPKVTERCMRKHHLVERERERESATERKTDRERARERERERGRELLQRCAQSRSCAQPRRDISSTPCWRIQSYPINPNPGLQAGRNRLRLGFRVGVGVKV